MLNLVATVAISLISGIVLIWFLLHIRGSSNLIKCQYQQLKGKVVLITGASSGIGKACCFAFHKYGCKVILCSRNVEELEKVKQKLECQNTVLFNQSMAPQVYFLDVSDLENIQANVDNVIASCGGTVDILVNNAGISCRGNIATTSLKVFQKIMNVNFLGQVGIAKAVLSQMLQNNAGCIVGIGSVQGKLGIPNRAPYAASKHASQAFYDSLRAEVAGHNVKVILINPGYVSTNLSLNALTDNGSTYGKLDKSTAKGMSPDDIAKEVIDAIIYNKKEVMLAPWHNKLAVWIRLIIPNLYFWIMCRRANK